MLSFGNILIKRLKNKIHTAVRRNLEIILQIKTSLKMSISFKFRGPKVELRFCSCLGCDDYGTAGTDNENE